MGNLTFIDFPIAVDPNLNVPYDIILSATMFSKMDLNFDFTNKTMLIKVKRMESVRNLSSDIINGKVTVHYNGSFSEEQYVKWVYNQLEEINIPEELARYYRKYLREKKIIE